MQNKPDSQPLLEISLLGRFQAKIDGVPVDEKRWVRRSAKWLVKLLALKPSHALLPGSIAIDAGNSSETTDQRGFTRPVDDPNSPNGSGNLADIGAFEFQPAVVMTFIVNSTNDPGDGTCDVTECTLREAITAANATADDDIINFDASLAGQTITLNGTDLDIDDNGTLTINGLGADQLSVSGNNTSRVFLINSGANVTINGITVTGGNETNGGGIRNNSGTTTTLNNSIIANSTSGGDCSGTVNSSFSLIEDGSCGVMNGVTNNLTGDPNLGPLQNNGGPTETHALLRGSIAIDAGNNALIPAGITTDQRGQNRIIDGDNNGSAIVDIGSFEALASTAVSVSVAGKVRTPNGKGLTNAYVTLTDSSGKYRLARTTAFGYFRFEDVSVGETYIIQVLSKRYRFTPQVLSITQDIADLELTMQNIFSRARVKE